jgi:hypothetical protein
VIQVVDFGSNGMGGKAPPNFDLSRGQKKGSPDIGHATFFEMRSSRSGLALEKSAEDV